MKDQRHPYSAAILWRRHEFAAAFGHGLAGARDRIGEVVIGDRARQRRRADRAAPAAPIAFQVASVGARMQPAHRRRSRNAVHLSDDGARNGGEIVIGQALAEHFGQRAQDRPVFLGLARREGGAAGALHPALEIDVEAVLLGIGGARQDHIG